MSEPKIHIWDIRQAVNGTWTLNSGTMWCITGFEDHASASDWVANYLIEYSRMNLQHQAMDAHYKEDRERDRMLSVAPLMEPDSKPN